MSIIKLAIGLPAYGGRVSAEHTRMFLELGHTLATSEARFSLASWNMVDVCGIDIARNMLLGEAHRASADWLLMIDSDTWVIGVGDDSAGFQLLRMISEADRIGAAIVGPAVHRRATKESREVMAYRNALDGGVMALRTGDIGDINGELMEIDALATSCFALNLKRCGQAQFKFTETLSEDLDFCRQIKELGGKIMLDGRMTTAHLSRPFPIVFNGEVIEKKTGSLILP